MNWLTSEPKSELYIELASYPMSPQNYQEAVMMRENRDLIIFIILAV